MDTARAGGDFPAVLPSFPLHAGCRPRRRARIDTSRARHYGRIRYNCRPGKRSVPKVSGILTAQAPSAFPKVSHPRPASLRTPRRSFPTRQSDPGHITRMAKFTDILIQQNADQPRTAGRSRHDGQAIGSSGWRVPDPAGLCHRRRSHAGRGPGATVWSTSNLKKSRSRRPSSNWCPQSVARENVILPMREDDDALRGRRQRPV